MQNSTTLHYDQCRGGAGRGILGSDSPASCTVNLATAFIMVTPTVTGQLSDTPTRELSSNHSHQLDKVTGSARLPQLPRVDAGGPAPRTPRSPPPLPPRSVRLLYGCIFTARSEQRKVLFRALLFCLCMKYLGNR